MNQELQALLVVQGDDEVIRDIEARLEALLPRLRTLEAVVKRVREEVARTDSAIEKELVKHRALEERIAEHKLRHERNVGILNQAHKIKEATAAAAQVEAARRMLADEEGELSVSARRLSDLRAAVAGHREQLTQVEAEQATVRASLAAQRAVIDAELATARDRRAGSARGVGPSLLSRYERVMTRRQSAALFALNTDYSCGACETAIPLQRRLPMSTGMIVEPCEGCGVLLYWRVQAPAEV